MKFKIPAALKLDPVDMRAALARAMKEPGPVGRPAQTVAKLVNAHFAKEEEFVVPTFALMHDLAMGQWRAEMANVLLLIFRLEAEHDGLVAEHKSIRAALEALMEVAHKNGNIECAQMAYNLMVHGKVEETVIYPMVLLIGNYIRRQLGIKADK